MDPPAVYIRWPRPEDLDVGFDVGGGLRGRVDWAELLAHHDPPKGRFSFVAECGGEVFGVATATVYGDEVEVEYLARNQAARGQRVGPKLLNAVLSLAWAAGAPWVTLESLDDPRLLAFYEECGFSRAGPPRFDASWGTLHPMRRPPASGVP